MKVVYYPDHLPESGHYAATIGFFDGVHRGHQSVIRQLKLTAQARGCQSMVITFEKPPRQVLQPEWQPQLLSTLDEKIRLLRQTGIDVLVVLRFDLQMAAMSARQFMKAVLHDDLYAEVLLTGYDNRFGHNRTEGFSDYVSYGRELGIEVMQTQAVDQQDGQHISSSLIRNMIVNGDMTETLHCLGRPYRLNGLVVHGEQIGRQLGFPTANLHPENNERLVPAAGVYAVSISIEDYPDTFLGMMYIGTRPTFDGHRQTLEVNIFDFKGNIYGKRLSVAFLERIRSEQHFNSPDELIEQMKQDKTIIIEKYEKSS